MIKLIERTDIKLETPADCWRALLDGFRLVSGQSILVIKDGMLWNERLRVISCETFARASDIGFTAFEAKELEWHDNLPEEKGELPVVICWVGHIENFAKDYIQGIYSKTIDENGKIQFLSYGTSWAYAIPVTKEEFENMNGNYLK